MDTSIIIHRGKPCSITLYDWRTYLVTKQHGPDTEFLFAEIMKPAKIIQTDNPHGLYK